MERPGAVKGHKKRGEKMERPGAVKGHKKRKKRDEEEQVLEEKDEKKAEEAFNELPGIPLVTPKSKSGGGVIFVLERASMEVGKVGKQYGILTSDDHANFLKRQDKNPADYRPDILHQALLSILDSPLNKAGRVNAVYVKTENGILFEVKPYVRIPRTCKRFCGLMSQLLQKLSISAATKQEKLLRVIKNPITQHLPANCHKIGLSYSSEKLVRLRDYVSTATDNDNLVFVVGAMAHGKIDAEYVDDLIAVSGYPLSAACCLGRICIALERKWNIV